MAAEAAGSMAAAGAYAAPLEAGTEAIAQQSPAEAVEAVQRSPALRSAEQRQPAVADAQAADDVARVGAQPAQRRGPMSEGMLHEALDKMDDFVRATYHHLEYNVHEATGEYIVKVVDDESGEVVREIPPEKLLDIYADLMEMVGIFYDERR
jgi:flagellar protein FlaG